MKKVKIQILMAGIFVLTYVLPVLANGTGGP